MHGASQGFRPMVVVVAQSHVVVVEVTHVGLMFFSVEHDVNVHSFDEAGQKFGHKHSHGFSVVVVAIGQGHRSPAVVVVAPSGVVVVVEVCAQLLLT